MRQKASGHGERFALWQAPIGWLAVVTGSCGVVEITSGPDAAGMVRRLAGACPEAQEGVDDVITATITQLNEYFAGARRHFNLPLDWRDLSPFAVAILDVLQTVPFGTTVSYGDLAAMAGRPGAARAVGRVMAGNPFPIVVPCHRVLGCKGSLTGYSGGEGIATKEWLLDFEGRQSV